MDVATILLSGLVSAISSICIMIVFYSRWILPYLTNVSESIPSKVKELVFPYVDEMITQLKAELNDTVSEVSASVRATSARLSRSIDQAEEYLQSQGVTLNPDDPASVDNTVDVLKEKYGKRFAMQVIDKLLASYSGPKTPSQEVVSDGWN